MRAEEINEASVMRVTGNRVLIIFDSIEDRDCIVSSGMMSTWFERVENWKSTCGMEQRRVWLSIYGVPIHAWKKDTFEQITAIGVRVFEAELFLRGPRVSRVAQEDRSDGSNSDSEDMMANSAAKSRVGPVVPYKGTAVDVIMYRGSRRKVQLLNDVIRSVQSPAEVLANAKRKGKGRGRPRKEGEVPVRRIASNSPSVIADISITDSDVNCRQSVILWEVKATVGLGKLIGATTIVNEEVWWLDSFVFDFVPSFGLSGGILVVWDPSKFDVALVTHDPNFLCLRGHWVSDSWESLMIAVYAPCIRSKRRDLWVRLLAVISAVEIPCCLGGDFNEVTNNAERRGCVGDWGGMLEFVGFIHDGGFLDMPAAGKVFTWYGSEAKGCRLDRFLVSTDWLDRFEGLEQRNLLRNVSDHDPVRLSCGVVNWGPRPFRFLNAWLERKGHIKWNRESFGCVETQIKTTTVFLNDLDDRVNELDEENTCLRRKVQGDL
ncbi:hypothetical protein GQ457_07G010370 [Hibiscus cannabinus]